MKRFLCSCALFAISTCCVQAQQTSQSVSLTIEQRDHIRSILMRLGSIYYPDEVIRSGEDALVYIYGLNQAEVDIVRAVAQELRTTLTALRASTDTITAGKTFLGNVEMAALRSLSARREQVLDELVNKVVSSLTPDAAGRLKTSAEMILRAAESPEGSH